MSDFNSLVEKYTIKESNKIKKICEPLQLHFGVNHFWYSRTSAQGAYFTIASNPEMHDFYHSTKLHLHSPFFRKPTLISPGLYYYRNIKDKKFLDTVDTVSARVNVNLGVGIVIRQNEELIRFGYAVDPKKEFDVIDLVLNNFPLLKKFNAFFLREISDLLNKAQDDLIDLPSEIGALYHVAPKGLQAGFMAREKCKFFDSLGLLNNTDVQKLTKREKECLKLTYEGLSAYKIGLRLGISKRTVETHIVALKNKLGCFSKEELIKKADLLHCADVLEN